jgi:hypothetical protein
MTIAEAVRILKQALAALQSSHPAKVEVAAEQIKQVIAGLLARRHK